MALAFVKFLVAGVGRGGRSGPGVGLCVFGRWGRPRTHSHAADGRRCSAGGLAAAASGAGLRLSAGWSASSYASVDRRGHRQVIGVPVAGLVAFKYFGHKRRTAGARGLLCFVAAPSSPFWPTCLSDHRPHFVVLRPRPGLWDFERNSLETLKGLFAELDLAVAECGLRHLQRGLPAGECGVLEGQAGTMTNPILRGERFCLLYWASRIGVGGDDGVGMAEVRTSGTSSMGPWRFKPIEGRGHALTSSPTASRRCSIRWRIVHRRSSRRSGPAMNWAISELSRACSTVPRRGRGRPEQAWMIGDDHEADVVGAVAAGWRAVHFSPEEVWKFPCLGHASPPPGIVGGSA